MGSKSSFCGTLLAITLGVAACSSGGGGGGGSDGGGGGGSDAGGSTLGGDDGITTTYNWAAIPLVNDTVARTANDRVADIYFESMTKGFVVTQGAGQTLGDGGAVFTATATAVTGVAFSDSAALTPSDFYGIERTPTGYIALSFASELVASTNGGTTFSAMQNGAAAGFSIEPTLGFQLSAGGTIVRQNGTISTTADSSPTSSSAYQTIWAPDAASPVPATRTASECSKGPRGAGAPFTRYTVFISADRSLIAYTSTDANAVPVICVSTDSGHSFTSRSLSAPDTASGFAPSGVVFLDHFIGVAWFGKSTAGAYIKRTKDTGATWTDVALPAAIAAHDLDLRAGFFSPNAQHGWIVGFDHDASAAVLLESRDFGATWTTVDGFGAAIDGFGGQLLFSGFALDGAHLWVGGELGLMAHN